MSWVVVTRPDEPVPSLEEVKAHLRASDFDDDDADILSKIWGAITEFEDPLLGKLGACILAREIEVSLPLFSTCIPLPCGPVLVDDEDYLLVVTYDDEGGIEQTVPDTVYRLMDPSSSDRRLVLKSGQSWPQAYAGDAAVRVRYWAGYDADDTRVNNFKTAVKLHVQMTYDGETEVDRNLPDTINRLLQPYRSMFV
jgi:uncharacterized phiE125 gp8 family phage protein